MHTYSIYVNAIDWRLRFRWLSSDFGGRSLPLGDGGGALAEDFSFHIHTRVVALPASARAAAPPAAVVRARSRRWQRHLLVHTVSFMILLTVDRFNSVISASGTVAATKWDGCAFHFRAKKDEREEAPYVRPAFHHGSQTVLKLVSEHTTGAITICHHRKNKHCAHTHTETNASSTKL